MTGWYTPGMGGKGSSDRMLGLMIVALMIGIVALLVMVAMFVLRLFQ